MYIDLVVLVVLILVVIMYFRRFSSFVYFIGIVDIFLRVLDFIANNIPVPVVTNFINSYFPNSITHIIEMYSSGIFTTVLLWALCIIYIILLSYLIRTFWKKK